MKGKVTVIAVVVVTLATSAYLLTLGNPRDQTESSGVFATGLAQRVGSITRIELLRGQESITLTRSLDGSWRVATSDGYLALTAQVAGLVNGLATLEKDVAMTAKREKFGELSLAWPSTEPGGGALVRLFDTPDGSSSSAPFAEYVVGQERGSPRSQYMRLLSEDQCWRCRGSVSIDTEPQRWVDATLLSLPASEVHTAQIGGLTLSREAYGKQWTATIAEDAVEAWTPERLREAESVFPSWLSRLEFDDVRKPKLAQSADAVTHTLVFDSLRAKLVVYCVTEQGRMWARFEVTPHEGAPARDAGLNGDVNAKHKYQGDPEIPDWAAWHEAHKDWEFRLPQWKVEQLKAEPREPQEVPRR